MSEPRAASPASKIMTGPTAQPTLELRFPSRPDHLALIRACVEHFASSIGFPPEECHKLVLAIDEALANVIRHGYRGRHDGPVRLLLAALETGGLRVVLEDEGERFDPAEIAPRDLREVRPGGLGLHIIRSTFSRCSWHPRPGGGMRVELEAPLVSTSHSGPITKPS